MKVLHQWITKNLVGFSLASFLNDFSHEMTTVILPTYINQITGTSLAPSILGIIQGISDAASTGAKLFAGWLADHVNNYKPYLIVGYGLTGIFVGLMGTTESIMLILLYKTIAWISRGFREPIRDTWLSKITPPQWYGHAFGFNRAFDTLGALVGPLLVYILLQYHTALPLIFYIAIIPGILSVVPILFLTTQEKKPGSIQKSINFFGQFKQLPTEFIYFSGIILFFSIIHFNQALLIFRVQELLGISSSIYAGLSWTVLLYVCSTLTRAVAEFGMGFLSDYVNRPLLLALFGFGFFGITCLGFMLNTTQLWVWLIFFITGGFSAGVIKTLVKAEGAYILPEPIRGTGMGILETIEGIGSLVSSVTVGGLWTLFSNIVALSYAAAISFTAMILMLYFSAHKK